MEESGKVQIIIPMSGTGERFKKAGYKDIKPLIKINGKPIIEYVVSMFPKDSNFIFICRDTHLVETDLEQLLKKLSPNSKIVPIKGHKLGPVHAVLQATEHIKDDEDAIVSYCDYFMHWDYNKFKQKMIDNKFAGAIPCYKGFHPHLLGNDFYAGCKTDSNNNLLEIKEKYSFTKNKMDTFQSAGAYYFQKGSYIKKYFQKLIDSKENINGEYYVSMVYPLMLQDKLPIYVENVPFFCQWGTPYDLEEFIYWQEYFLKEVTK